MSWPTTRSSTGTTPPGFAFVTLSGMYARRAFPGFAAYEPKYLEQAMARDGYDGSLRDAMGDDAFRRGIRLLFERYRYRTFTVDQFISVFEECAKRSRRASVRAVLSQTSR